MRGVRERVRASIALPVRVSLHLTLSPTLYRRTPAHRSSPPCRACYRRSGGEVGWGVAKTLQGSGGRRTDRTDQAYQDLPRSTRQLRSQESCTALSHRGTVVSRIILRRSARGPRCLLALCVTPPFYPLAIWERGAPRSALACDLPCLPASSYLRSDLRLAYLTFHQPHPLPSPLAVYRNLPRPTEQTTFQTQLSCSRSSTANIQYPGRRRLLLRREGARCRDPRRAGAVYARPWGFFAQSARSGFPPRRRRRRLRLLPSPLTLTFPAFCSISFSLQTIQFLRPSARAFTIPATQTSRHSQSSGQPIPAQRSQKLVDSQRSTEKCCR